jgi:heat shock protein HtpX
MLNEDVQKAHDQHNLVHTVALLLGIGSLLAVPVVLIWGVYGLVIVVAVVAALFGAAWQTPPELLMRAYRATRLNDQSNSQLVRIMGVLAERAELPKTPALYIIPSLTLNAFATGSRTTAAVAVTEGLLRKLSTKELAAVLAHEISHIKNNDTLVMGIADIASRLVQGMSYLALILLMTNIIGLVVDGERHVSWLAIIILYLAPLLSSLMQLGLSRTREYDADLEAAQLIGNPSWLASALVRIERNTGAFWEDLTLPVPGRRVPAPSLLRSHPTTEDRVARLQQLSTNSSVPPVIVLEEPFVSVIDAGLIEMRPRYRFPGIWF